MALRQSSMVGRCVAKLTGGMNSGWKPYQTWNGDCPVALWARTSVAAVRLTTNRLHKTGYAVHHGFHNLT